MAGIRRLRWLFLDPVRIMCVHSDERRPFASDLEGLAEEDRQAYNELKRLDREAKMLVSDFDLAVIKRKREELEQDEERIKKRKQALVDED